MLFWRMLRKAGKIIRHFPYSLLFQIKQCSFKQIINFTDLDTALSSSIFTINIKR
jgi:hypothetical protein